MSTTHTVESIKALTAPPVLRRVLKEHGLEAAISPDPEKMRQALIDHLFPTKKEEPVAAPAAESKPADTGSSSDATDLLSNHPEKPANLTRGQLGALLLRIATLEASIGVVAGQTTAPVDWRQAYPALVRDSYITDSDGSPEVNIVPTDVDALDAEQIGELARLIGVATANAEGKAMPPRLLKKALRDKVTELAKAADVGTPPAATAEKPAKEKPAKAAPAKPTLPTEGTWIKAKYEGKEYTAHVCAVKDAKNILVLWEDDALGFTTADDVTGAGEAIELPNGIPSRADAIEEWNSLPQSKGRKF